MEYRKSLKVIKKENDFLNQASKKIDQLLFQFIRQALDKNGIDLQEDELKKLLDVEAEGLSQKLNKEIIRMSDYGASTYEIKKVIVPMFVSVLKNSMRRVNLAINSKTINEARKAIFKTDIFDNYITEFLELLSKVKDHEQLKGGEES